MIEICEDCRRFAWNLISLKTSSRVRDSKQVHVCHTCLHAIAERSGGIMATDMGGKVSILLPKYQYELPGGTDAR